MSSKFHESDSSSIAYLMNASRKDSDETGRTQNELSDGRSRLAFK